jgi:hypothetical protein
LLVLAAVQLMLVLLSPSTPTSTTNASAGGAFNHFAAGTSGSTSASVPGGSATDNGAGATTGAVSSTGGAAGVTGATGTGSGATGGTVGGGGSNSSGPVDRSRCDTKGLEIGVTYYMPPCVPPWTGGDNGGTTMPGVSATKINYLFYRPQGNAEVNAILGTQGLAATDQQFCAAVKAFHAEINKRWEAYGRTYVSLNGPGNHNGAAIGNPCSFPYFQGQCSLTPPDPPCERAEADLIASMHPAYVMAPVADPSFYNQLGKDHVIVAGGENEPDTYHTSVAPYYYDVFMSGTRAMAQAAEYYCKRLYNRPVKWAGTDVEHPTGPISAPPRRKIAIVYPATNGDPTYAIPANQFIHAVTGGMCGSPSDNVKAFPYQSDITTAEQQSTTQIAALKASGVTTVVFYGDPIAPVFLTNTAESQGYHPEWLVTGTGLVDYDVLGQLYNGDQWQHAFGISDLTNSIPFAQSDAAKAAHDVGAPQPDPTENLAWSYYSLMATSFQDAGPMPTANAIQGGLFSAPGQGGDPYHALLQFGRPNDFTGLQDAREVYWCDHAISPINGHQGMYVPIDGGVRRSLGQWPNTEPAAFPHGFC